MSRLTDVKLTLLVKLARIAVHADAILANSGNGESGRLLHMLLSDPEVVIWLNSMDAAGMVPKSS